MPRPLSTDSNGNYIAHILMVGDSSSGKTSLVLRFDLDVFTSKFVTTIGVDHKDKIVKVDGLGMRLQVMDALLKPPLLAAHPPCSADLGHCGAGALQELDVELLRAGGRVRVHV